MEQNYATAVLTCLMLHGQIHSSVQVIANRIPGGELFSPDLPCNVPGSSVLNVLKQKHPQHSKVVPFTLMCCNPLPPLPDLISLLAKFLVKFRGCWSSLLKCFIVA